MGIKPRVFIASSGLSRPFVEKLVTELERASDGWLEVEPWFRPADPAASSHLMTRLVDWSKKCDFAIVVLTRDLTVSTGEASTIEVPRDNCIFELGLFVGAFGGSERCILLSEIEHDVLVSQLSDVGGLLYEPLDSDLLESEEGRAAEAKRLAGPIRARIAAIRRFAERPRSPALLIEDILERETDPDIVSRHDVVLIKEQQPVELSLAYARPVMENILDRQVRYHFLFGRTAGKYEAKIVEMLRSLVASTMIRGPSGVNRFDDGSGRYRKKTLARAYARYPEKIQGILNALRRDLVIGLVDEVEFDEFCIHRANVKRRRKGYLKVCSRRSKDGRFVDRFVPLEETDTALRMQHRGYGIFTDKTDRWPTRRIFQSARGRQVTKREREGLTASIQYQFPESFSGKVLEICFGST